MGGEWIKKLWDITCGVLVSQEKGHLPICNNMGEPEGYYAEYSQSVRERQIAYDLTYMWTLTNKINETTQSRTISKKS